MPEIRILHLLDGARAASGLTVVIDVFRAFSVAPLAIQQGAVRIHPVATPAEALAMRTRHPDWLLMGERDGRPLPGFDFGNSPADIVAENLSGRVLVQRTGAGVQGLLAAAANTEVSEVVTGSFVNARAVVAYVRARQPVVVSLVAMGWNGTDRTLDDVLCAEYLARGLETGVLPPLDTIRERLRGDSCGAKFFDPTQPWFRPEDFELCLRPSCINVVLQLGKGPGGVPVLGPRSADRAD